MNYVDTFIAVADDCKTAKAKVPEARGTAKTVAQIQYEMLIDNPFEFTQEDVLFESWFARQDLSNLSKAAVQRHREAFFAKDQPCLRTSPLTRTYGWGMIFDANGKVALCPVESQEYRRRSTAADVKIVKALRSKRG